MHGCGQILPFSLKATWSIIKDERRIDHALRAPEYRQNDKDESGTDYATLSAEKHSKAKIITPSLNTSTRQKKGGGGGGVGRWVRIEDLFRDKIWQGCAGIWRAF